MNEAEVREILKSYIMDEDDSLFCPGAYYVAWEKGDPCVMLEGRFTFKELQAIAWWMENKAIFKS